MAAALFVEIQGGACVLVGVVRVDLHEVAKHVVCEEAQRQHAAVLGQAVQLRERVSCMSQEFSGDCWLACTVSMMRSGGT